MGKHVSHVNYRRGSANDKNNWPNKVKTLKPFFYYITLALLSNSKKVMPLKQLSGWVVSSVVTVVNLYEIHFLRIR